MSTQAEKTLALINVTNELLKRAQAEKDAVRERIPRVVEALVENERIYENQKEAVAKSCEDPAQVLDMMVELACHRTAKEAEALGQPYKKEASATTSRTLGSPVHNWDETEAGRRFREALLGS